MNNNPYDQNHQNTTFNNQQSFNNNPYAQDASNNYVPQALTLNEPPKMNGLAIASMILGIVSLCCCCSSYACGILAIVFGIVAKCCGNKTGKSTAGIICGAISMGLTTLMFIVSFLTGMLDAFEAPEMALFISRMHF